MNPITIKKLSLSCALAAFAVLAFGSAAAGARLTTAFVRGLEAALLFGGLSWSLVSWLLPKRLNPVTPPPARKGGDVDETA